MKSLRLFSVLSVSLVGVVASGCAGATTGESEEGNLGSVSLALGGSLPGFVTSLKPYVVSVSAEYAFQPLLSVGDRVPRTADPSQEFQMVGIPTAWVPTA